MNVGHWRAMFYVIITNIKSPINLVFCYFMFVSLSWTLFFCFILKERSAQARIMDLEAQLSRSTQSTQQMKRTKDEVSPTLWVWKTYLRHFWKVEFFKKYSVRSGSVYTSSDFIVTLKGFLPQIWILCLIIFLIINQYFN